MSDRQRVAENHDDDDRREDGKNEGEEKEADSLAESLARITESRASLGEDAKDHVESLVESFRKQMEGEVDEEHEEQMHKIEQGKKEARELLEYLQKFTSSADQTARDIQSLIESDEADQCFTHEEIAKLEHIAEKLEDIKNNSSITTAQAMQEKLKLHREFDLIIAAAKDRCSQSKAPAYLSIFGGAVAGAAGGAALGGVVPILGNIGGAILGGIAGGCAGAVPVWKTLFPGRNDH